MKAKSILAASLFAVSLAFTACGPKEETPATDMDTNATAPAPAAPTVEPAPAPAPAPMDTNATGGDTTAADTAAH